ncbi:hypothetical protein NMY22_g9854 [Coprinellus aureogranulatus]|nr:hypothetical protein NMY22_g9854 [Coprinellus aureogranulatus]
MNLCTSNPGCFLCQIHKQHAQNAQHLPQTAKEHTTYHCNVLHLPNKVDQWLSLMAATAQEHEYPDTDIGVFSTFGVNYSVECEICVCEVHNKVEGKVGPLLFVNTVNFFLELKISILYKSGFIAKPQGSPWICLAKYCTGADDDTDLLALDWVINSGVFIG